MKTLTKAQKEILTIVQKMWKDSIKAICLSNHSSIGDLEGAIAWFLAYHLAEQLEDEGTKGMARFFLNTSIPNYSTLSLEELIIEFESEGDDPEGIEALLEAFDEFYS